MFVVCVCVCACGVHACVSWYSAFFAFEPTAYPSHPFRYARLLLPCSRAHVTCPMGGGTLSSCLPALVSVLVCLRFVVNLVSNGIADVPLAGLKPLFYLPTYLP